MTRVAAVDCGTNTIRLLIADLDLRTGEEAERCREMRIVRLGQDVDRTGRLASEALARTFAAIDEYAAIIRAHAVDAIRFCATSAARDAANADEFASGVEARLDVRPDVLTGAEEARLSYDGATRSLADLDVRTPYLVVDIGGGSTELILGDRHGDVRAARSLDVGSVRLTERCLPSDPPAPDGVAAATAVIDAALDSLGGQAPRPGAPRSRSPGTPPGDVFRDAAGVDLAAARTLVGVAGTVTTLAAMVLDLPAYRREAVHHASLPASEVHRATRRLLAMTLAERAALPFMHPGRADVIGAGALILDRVLRRAGPGWVLVSEHDLLDGIAWSRA